MHVHAASPARLSLTSNDSTASSSPHAATWTPRLQPPATWADLPDDIVRQLMVWVMCNEGSEASLSQLAAASKSLSESVRAFRDSPAYVDIRSCWEHAVAMPATRAHLENMKYSYLNVYFCSSEWSVKFVLEPFSVPGNGAPIALMIGEDLLKNQVPADNLLQYFREHAKHYVPIQSRAKPWECSMVKEIALALPAKACMSLHIDEVDALYPAAVQMIAQVASTGCRAGLTLLGKPGSVIDPKGLSHLMDVLCGPGRIPWLRLNRLDDGSPLLDALAARCSELHALRLVTLICNKGLTDSGIIALRDALLHRQQRGQCRITVVIECAALSEGRHEGSLLSSETERAALERAGLYFDLVGIDQDLFVKLQASVAEGPPARWQPMPASSKPTVPDQHSEPREVNRKKKDKCVVS